MKEKCTRCKKYVLEEFMYDVKNSNFLSYSYHSICPWCIILVGQRLKADFIKSGAKRNK